MPWPNYFTLNYKSFVSWMLVRCCCLVCSKYFCSQSGEILMKAQHTRRLWNTMFVEYMTWKSKCSFIRRQFTWQRSRRFVRFRAIFWLGNKSWRQPQRRFAKSYSCFLLQSKQNSLTLTSLPHSNSRSPWLLVEICSQSFSEHTKHSPL